MSPGEQILDLLHVDDLCRAFLRAAELTADPTQASTAIYAVSGGQRRTLRAVVETLEQVSGRILPVTWGARPYREREVMLPWTGPSLPGWQPIISLEDGLRSLLNAEDLTSAQAGC
jgi:nucleoside-diphosphate-sugar epimerase